MKGDYRAIFLDIRSAHNVGSMLRTADAAGLSSAYLVGTTPAPIDRFGRANKEIAKTALGAERAVACVQAPSAPRLIAKLRQEGFAIIAIEQHSEAIDYKKVKAGRKAAFVVGNEVGGVPERILSLCDAVAEIPMSGSKESLNVSVAFGVAVFRMLGR